LNIAAEWCAYARLAGSEILGRSDMPECDCHTAVFATGNNIGSVLNSRTFEALDERPELRIPSCQGFGDLSQELLAPRGSIALVLV
jgi:hypothetical protein